MRYQVDCLLSLKLQKLCYFGLCRQILLANQFAGFFTFDLFGLLILTPGIHCYIVLNFLLLFSQCQSKYFIGRYVKMFLDLVFIIFRSCLLSNCIPESTYLSFSNCCDKPKSCFKYLK